MRPIRYAHDHDYFENHSFLEKLFSNYTLYFKYKVKVSFIAAKTAPRLNLA